MKPYEIIIQVFCIALSLYTGFSHKKRNVLIAAFVFNISTFLLYFLIKDFSTFSSMGIVTVRSLVFLFQDRLKKLKCGNAIPLLFVICHIVVGFLTVEHWYQILGVIAPITLTLSFWFEKSRQRMRIEQATSDSLWFVYNLCVGLYILCALRVVEVLISVVAFIKNRNNTSEEC